MESGRTCKRIDGASLDDEDSQLDVELDDATDRVLIRFRGRLIRTLTGVEAAAVRDALDDPDRLQRLLVSKTKGKRV